MSPDQARPSTRRQYRRAEPAPLSAVFAVSTCGAWVASARQLDCALLWSNVHFSNRLQRADVTAVDSVARTQV